MAKTRKSAQVEPEVQPVQAVERPILCSPYDVPTEHWYYPPKEKAKVMPGRRPASYFFTTDKGGGTAQLDVFAEENRAGLALVNRLRDDVRRWRESGYEGATQTTKTLLRYWANPERERRLFFCQREAVETVIYLVEMLEQGRKPRFGPKVSVEDFQALVHGENPSFAPETTLPMTLLDGTLRRYGCKMATGSGKTVVMAMLIAWAFCNRGAVPGATQFPGAVLILGPNLTVKDRLQVLRPDHPQNYYDRFDLVPSRLRDYLAMGRVLVTNWHALAPESAHVEGGKSFKVVDKGEEGPDAFARRILGDLYDRGPILVLNDEAHHCYQPKQVETAEDKEATVWFGGLERLAAVGLLRLCVDVSATPFYLGGSGYVEGSPFPWLVSDFGLVDAIESGITKIPRLPVSDTTGKPEPQFFQLWKHITDHLKPGEKLTGGKPKPEVVWREAETALKTLASQWLTRFQQMEAARPGQDIVPPVLIVVCDNTEIAEYFYRQISGEWEEEVDATAVPNADAPEGDDGADETEGDAETETPAGKKKKKVKRTYYGSGKLLEEFSNHANARRTLRIDSKLLAEAEDPTGGGGNRKEAAERLRQLVATVGQRGQPGEQVRCVVSVQMLSEGWDANNVTHILGLRAFGSQLLCEQVVGRALRRLNYEPNADGKLPEEYADVYGVPFSLIPYRGGGGGGGRGGDPVFNRVRALPARAHMEIRFPVVEGYTFGLRRNSLRADIDKMQPLAINPSDYPTQVFVQPQVGYNPNGGVGQGPFETELCTREAYYEQNVLQTILFEISRRIVTTITESQQYAKSKLRHQSRHQLFPQVLRFATEYVEKKVDFKGVDQRELGMEAYQQQIVERLLGEIGPDDSQGEPPLLPDLNRTRPTDSTARVNFTTSRPVKPATKSHLDYVVCDTESWEQIVTFGLEASPLVKFYARNDHLECTIPYEFMGLAHAYLPDFLVRLTNGVTLLLEVKGYERPDAAQKHQAARKWVQAVNNWGALGKWAFAVCRDPHTLKEVIETVVKETTMPNAPVES